MRRFRLAATVASAAAVALVAPVAVSAQAPVTVRFNEYASPTVAEYDATPGRPVTSGGFDFYAAFGTGARNALGTWGNDPAVDPDTHINRPTNIGSSTAMFGTQAGERMDMYVAGDNPFAPVRRFNLFSIDVAHLFNQAYLADGTVPAPFTLSFTGFLGGSSITQTFSIGAPSGPTPFLSTLLFDGRWRGLQSVAWSQSGAINTQHQFTNVVASVVPEPGTYAMLAVGLGMLGAVRVRRRRA